MPTEPATEVPWTTAPTPPTDSQYAIQVRGLVKRFGKHTAVDGIDLAVRTGTVLGLLGPNGAGKTTTVRMLATLLEPDGGHAIVGGYDVVTEANSVRQTIGMTGQYASVDEMLTGTQNLVLIARLLGFGRTQAKQRAAELLGRFRLTDSADKPVKAYSGGMRRRLDLAASLIGGPRVLFLDEPTTGLDPRSRLELWELVRAQVAEGATVLLTTQYLEEADALADEIVVIDDGKVIAQGTPDELKATIGAQRLTVRPVDPAQLGQVVSTLAATTGTTPELEGHAATVAVTDADVLPTVVARLAAAGIAIGELAQRGSSLDEVFLALTGRPTTDSPADTGDGTTNGTTAKEMAA